MRRLGLAVSAVVGLSVGSFTTTALAATTPRATVITVQNVSSRVSKAQIRAAESAIVAEVRTRLRRYWHVKPITFGPHGSVTVKLYRGRGPGPGSYHYPGGAAVGTGYPRTGFEVLGHGGRANPWTVVFSHEVLEGLVDPSGARMIAGYPAEVCDPVESDSFKIDGIAVSDFVTQRWFGLGGTGRYDFMSVLSRPLSVAPGGFLQ